jgi:hypothetical protein
MWMEFLITALVIGVLTVVGTLVWWKIADRWVDDEKKRFKKPARPVDSDRIIVVRDPPERPG